MVKRVTLTVFNGEEGDTYCIQCEVMYSMVKRVTLIVFNGEKGDT